MYALPDRLLPRTGAFIIPLVAFVHACAADRAPPPPSPSPVPVVVEPSAFDERPVSQTCRAPLRPTTGTRLAPAFPRLTFTEPVGLVRGPKPTGRFYAIERGGVIRTFEDREDVPASTVFADLAAAGRIFLEGNEDGPLGLAFHPRSPRTARSS